MNKIIVYGISSCDNTRKVLSWYNKNNIPVDFYDYKISGINKDKLAHWIEKVGWQSLLNKKSTTWRSIPTARQHSITNENAAIQLMMEYTSIIKRPVVEVNNNVMVGFNNTMYIP